METAPIKTKKWAPASAELKALAIEIARTQGVCAAARHTGINRTSISEYAKAAGVTCHNVYEANRKPRKEPKSNRKSQSLSVAGLAHTAGKRTDSDFRDRHGKGIPFAKIRDEIEAGYQRAMARIGRRACA